MKTMALSAVLNPEGDGCVSLCPELDIASQGDTIEEAPAILDQTNGSGVNLAPRMGSLFVCSHSSRTAA